MARVSVRGFQRGAGVRGGRALVRQRRGHRARLLLLPLLLRRRKQGLHLLAQAVRDLARSPARYHSSSRVIHRSQLTHPLLTAI